MATTFKDHSTTEIEETIEKALGQLLGWPVTVNIGKVMHRRPDGISPWVAQTSWSADLELCVTEIPAESDSDLPF